MIATDIACVECGYNLRGLDPAGRCPECGTPVAASHRSDALRFSNLRWLRRVRLGALVLFTAQLFAPVALSISDIFAPASRLEAIVFWAAFCGIWWTGTHLLTSPEPRISMDKSRLIRRLFARRAARLAVASQVCVAAAAVARSAQFIPSFLFVVVLAIHAIAAYAVFAYIRDLADRVPSRRLAAWAIMMQWGWAAILALAALLGAIEAARASSSVLRPIGKLLDPLLNAAVPVTAVGGIALFLATLVFWNRLVYALRLAIDNAGFLAEKAKQKETSRPKLPLSM